jgi:DnaJ-class molecular chaperone
MKDFTEKCTACKGIGGDAFGPCTDCYGQGEIPDHAAKFDAYDKREPLVQEVIRLARERDKLWDRGGTLSEETRIRIDLVGATRKLAEWSP